MSALPRKVDELPAAQATALWQSWMGASEPPLPGLWPSPAHRELWLDGYLTMLGGGVIVVTAAGLRLLGLKPAPRLVSARRAAMFARGE